LKKVSSEKFDQPGSAHFPATQCGILPSASARWRQAACVIPSNWTFGPFPLNVQQPNAPPAMSASKRATVFRAAFFALAGLGAFFVAFLVAFFFVAVLDFLAALAFGLLIVVPPQPRQSKIAIGFEATEFVSA
jgi:hypothetical protein